MIPGEGRKALSSLRGVLDWSAHPSLHALSHKPSDMLGKPKLPG